MKRMLYLLLCAIIAIGCNKADVDVPNLINEGTMVVFSVNGSDGSTKANVALKNAASRLNYFNFNADGGLLKRRISVSMDIGYGSLVDTLKSGDYTVCFVGDNGSSSFSSTDGQKIWFDRVSDTFFCVTTQPIFVADYKILENRRSCVI